MSRACIVFAAAMLSWIAPVANAKVLLAWKAIDDTSALLIEAQQGRKRTEGFLGSVALGYLANSGNVDSTSLNTQLSLAYLTGSWRHASALKVIRSSSAGIETGEEYDFFEQSDYTLDSSNNYIFIAGNYQANPFGPYPRRTSAAIGVGHRLVDKEIRTLDLQLGAGTRRTEEINGMEFDETIITFAGKYDWLISENSAFSHQINVERGPTNTYSESVAAVSVKIRNNLSLSVSFTVKHNSEVPEDRTHTDKSTATSLSYGF